MRRALVFLAVAAAGAAHAQEKVSLTEAVRRAIVRNTSALLAEQEIARAEALLWQARSPALPQLIGNAVATRLDAARVLGSGAVISARDSLNANLQLTLPLLAPSRWTAWSHAKDQVAIARASADDVRRVLAVAAARAVLTVIAQKRLVQVNTQARDNARDHYETARAKLEVGSGNRLDVVRAGQEAAADEAQIASALAGVTRAQEALAVLIGSEVAVDVDENVNLEAPPTAEAAFQDAEQRRADVRATRERAEAARRVDRDWWQDYLPLVQGVFQPFYQDPSTATQPTTGWQAQLVLSLPIFDGGLRHGLHSERSALAAEARVQLDGLLRQARSEVRTGFDAVRRADQGLRAAREAARLAHEALDISQQAYRAGATNDLEVVDAERRARDADTAALVAEDTARQARIDLLAASGRFP